MSGVLLAGEERRRFEGALVPFRRCFGAGKKVFWCRQSIALVPGLLEGGRELDNSDKGQGIFCALGSPFAG